MQPTYHQGHRKKKKKKKDQGDYVGESAYREGKYYYSEFLSDTVKS